MNESEWERRRQAHQETERGYTTRREEKMQIDESTDVVTPSGNRIRQTPSGQRLFATPSGMKQGAEEVVEAVPKKGRTIKSRIKSKLRKIRSEQPETKPVVDEEIEAAKKKGYDAHMKDKRARDITKAEKQGRREAMTFKSKVVEDATTVAEKLEPVGKRVAKNVGKLMGEAKYTAKAAAKPRAAPRATTKPKAAVAATKPQPARKAKPGPVARHGTIGRREGGLPTKENKEGPGVRSKHGPTNR